MQIFIGSLLRVPPAVIAHHNPRVQAFGILSPVRYPALFIPDIDPISIIDSQTFRRFRIYAEDRVRTPGA